MSAPAPCLDPQSALASTFAEYRQLWARAERHEILTSYPLHLDIELTSHCNLRCEMCWQSGELKAPMGFMDAALFKRIISEGVPQGLASIKLQIRGESTLHPNLIELIRYAKAAGVLDIQLTTNGTVLADKPDLMDALLASGLVKLIFSVDPAHDQSALNVYGPERAPDVSGAIARAVQWRHENPDQGPSLRIQSFVIGSQTQACRLAEIKEAFPRADEYLINPLWNSKWDADSLIGLSSDYEFMPCTSPWTRLAILWNGQVHLCARDYNGVLPMGDANTGGIDSIWIGKPMMDIRRLHASGRRRDVKLCAHCDNCTRLKDFAKAPVALMDVTAADGSKPVLAVIQARMGSLRLPGKALTEIKGEPLLTLLLKRLTRSSKVNRIVLATTPCPEDDVLAEWAEELGLPVVRGPVNDLLARFVQTLSGYPAEIVLRITGDNPLIAPELIDMVVEGLLSGQVDYSDIESCPYGAGADGYTRQCLEECAASADTDYQREHLNAYVLDNPRHFKVRRLSCPLPRPDIRLTVDTHEDLERIRKLVSALPMPATASLNEIAAAWDQLGLHA